MEGVGEIYMNAMFSALGVLHVDHYAVTTKDLIATLKDFLSVPGAKLLRGPGENTAQQVYYAFVELNGMGVVEILAPLDDNSPILGHLGSGGGAYHLCYAVQNIEKAIKVAVQDFGAKLVVAPRADGAFDGRKVAFLVHPNHGLFELLEAYHGDSISICNQSIEYEFVDSIKDKLMLIYRSVIDSSCYDYDSTDMTSCPKWDSFKHLMLIMEIEKQFEISISASDMSKLYSLKKIENYLTNK